MDSPMVMMISWMTLALRTGRMVKRSISPPTMTVARTAAAIASGSGRLQAVRKNTLNIPPSMTNSPWAKLMMPVVLKMIVNPSPVSP